MLYISGGWYIYVPDAARIKQIPSCYLRNCDMGRKKLGNVRREELILAFFEVVAREGLINATTRKITQAAGMSSYMLHHYFDSKEALILGVLDYIENTYRETLLDRSRQGDSATERMKSLASWFVNLKTFDIDWFRALLDVRAFSKSSPAVFEALQRLYNDVKSVIAGIVKAGVESGEFREVDPAIAANTILACLDGIVGLWLMDPEGTPLKEVGKQIPEVFSIYLAPER